MRTFPTAHVSLCEVAKRAALALKQPPGGALDLRAEALWLIGGGEGWDAVLRDLQADNAHVPHTLRAFAWSPAMPEIPASFWRGDYKRQQRRIDHESLAAPDWRAHFMFDGEWTVPLVLESEAEAFIQRITKEQVRAERQARRKTESPGKNLRAWLTGIMRALPHGSPGKSAMKDLAVELGYDASGRKFNSIWAAAIGEPGAAAWGLPGRKSKTAKIEAMNRIREFIAEANSGGGQGAI